MSRRVLPPTTYHELVFVTLMSLRARFISEDLMKGVLEVCEYGAYFIRDNLKHFWSGRELGRRFDFLTNEWLLTLVLKDLAVLPCRDFRVVWRCELINVDWFWICNMHWLKLKSFWIFMKKFSRIFQEKFDSWSKLSKILLQKFSSTFKQKSPLVFEQKFSIF